jgi:4-cresol dehydrogenase (hydroxylating)
MPSPLPPLVSQASFDAALRAFERIVGAPWVRASEEARADYRDEYALGGAGEPVASAAVAPNSTEQVRAVLRIANEFRIPLWPISRGKNLGYGGAAPLLAGSVVLDLARMNRILEVDERNAHVVVEPGVSFFDLHEYLRAHRIPLWMSVPGHGLGSVVGNALERGFGASPRGDHAANLCGMEVVLPSGDLVRTGMGAMSDCKSWRHYPYGFGPHWDQMFVQSNFGIVTQAGVWLMPEPEATMSVRVNLPEAGDIEWFVDAMAHLRLRGVFEQPLLIGNYLRAAMVFSRRRDWHDGPGPIPEEVAGKIMRRFETGWWTADLKLFGYADVIKAQAEIARRAIQPRLRESLYFQTWRRGEPIERSAAGVPSAVSLQIADWLDGRGAHVGFSPVMPPNGRLAREQSERMRERFDEFGIDYYASFVIGPRHINNINLIGYDKDDPAMIERARRLFRVIIEDSARHGYGEYRTHLDFMQSVADTFDFNDHALWRLNEILKDALDPNGVLAPGKNGVWPARHRPGRD